MYRGTQQNPVSREASRTSARWLRRAAIAVSAAAVALLLAGGPGAFAAPSQPTQVTAQTNAIVKPSIVYISTTWTGFLTKATYRGHDIVALISSEDGTPQIKAETSCSGYIASPDGYIVSAGHCVDDTSANMGGKAAIIDTVVHVLEEHGVVNAQAAQDMRAFAYGHWTVEGKGAGSPPDRAVEVVTTGIHGSGAIPATVREFEPLNKGDLALLKINPQSPSLPALVVAPGPPEDGTPLVAAGYPGSVSGSVDANQQPSLKDGKVSSKQTVSGASFTEISAPVSQGMSGGPVADAQGRVLGVVSWGPATEPQPFNFMTETNALRDMLSRAGVSGTLSPTDQAYRAGLANYYEGKYRAAVKEFDKVLAQQPNHAQAQLYKGEAIQKYPQEKSGSNTLMWVLIGVGVLVLAALAAVTAVVISQRRRGGATGAQPPTEDRGGPTGIQPATEERRAATGAQPTPEERVTDGHTKAVGAPPPAEPTPPDVYDQLRKLGELRDSGVLTDEEFDVKKAELLRSSST